MRTIVIALIVSAVLWAWGLPSVPAQAGEQRAKQGSSHQESNTEARDARDDKEATAQDKNTKPSRDTSGLKDTAHQQDVSKHQDSRDSRDARDDKEAGSSSHQ
jgi:hypothetical protein